MDKQSLSRTVEFTQEFDQVFTRMLELAGFEHTSRAQRIRLLSGLQTVYPNLVDDLLAKKEAFIGPIVLA